MCRKIETAKRALYIPNNMRSCSTKEPEGPLRGIYIYGIYGIYRIHGIYSALATSFNNMRSCSAKGPLRGTDIFHKRALCKCFGDELHEQEDQ